MIFVIYVKVILFSSLIYGILRLHFIKFFRIDDFFDTLILKCHVPFHLALIFNLHIEFKFMSLTVSLPLAVINLLF